LDLVPETYEAEIASCLYVVAVAAILDSNQSECQVFITDGDRLMSS
jgi:hypothetical protein